MAIIVYGGVVGAASGKLGGLLFARRRGVDVVQMRGLRCRRESEEAVRVRGVYQQCRASWLAATDAERLLWTAAAAQYRFVNRLGVEHVLTGWQLFVFGTSHMRLCGITPFSGVQPKPRRSQSNACTLTNSGGTINATWTAVTYPGEFVVPWVYLRACRTWRTVGHGGRVTWFAKDSFVLLPDTWDVGAFLVARTGPLISGEWIGVETTSVHQPYMPGHGRRTWIQKS